MAQAGYGGKPQQMGGGGMAIPVAQPVHAQPMVDGMVLGPNTDIMIRHGFIRKVFGILFTQLAITFAMIFYLNKSMEDEW